MSMNACITAKRVVVVKDFPEIESTQLLHFDLWQTPTKVTNSIMESSVPFKEYKLWVMELAGFKAEDKKYAKRHLKELQNWITNCIYNKYSKNVRVMFLELLAPYLEDEGV